MHAVTGGCHSWSGFPHCWMPSSFYSFSACSPVTFFLFLILVLPSWTMWSKSVHSILETCLINHSLVTGPLVFHSLGWAALILPDPYPPITFSEVLSFLTASLYADLDIERIVSLRGLTHTKTTNPGLTCQVLGKTISDTSPSSNLNWFLSFLFPCSSLSLLSWSWVSFATSVIVSVSPHWTVSPLRADTW